MLWCRSDDKKMIIRVNEFHIQQDHYGYGIYCVVDKDSIILGRYSTEEKALKVLDMIESFLCEGHFGVGVFQFPKDKEVKVNGKKN